MGKVGFRSSQPTQPRTRSLLLTRDSSAPGPGQSVSEGQEPGAPRSQWPLILARCALTGGPECLSRAFLGLGRAGSVRPTPGAGAVAPPGLRHTPVRGAQHTPRLREPLSFPARVTRTPPTPASTEGDKAPLYCPGTRPAPAPARAGRYCGRRSPENCRGRLDKRTQGSPVPAPRGAGRWPGHVASAVEPGYNVQERPVPRAGKHTPPPWTPFPSVPILLAKP